MKAEHLGAKCSECPLKDAPGIIPTQVENPRHQILALVTDFPGRSEIKDNQFLTGPTGDLVRRRIFTYPGCEAPIHAEKVHITGGRLCYAAEKLSAKDAKLATECCRPRLENELRATKPKAILTTGATAALAVTKSGSLERILGAPLETEFGFVIPTYQPAMMFREKWAYMPVFRQHFQRAWALANGRLPPWKWRATHYFKVSKTMLHMLRLLKPPLAIDIETPRESPLTATVDVIGFCDGKRAVAVPWHRDTDDIDGLACETPENQLEQDIHNEVIKRLTRGCNMVWQHGRFDRFVFRRNGIRVRGRHFDLLPAHIMLMGATPHDLGFQACVAYHSPRWKEMHAEYDSTAEFDK